MPPEAETPEADAIYPLVVSLLTKLGVEVAARLAPEKAREHLAKKLGKKGVPADATPEEAALAEGMGFAAPKPEATGTAAEEAAGDATARALEDRTTPPGDGPVPFRLKMKGQEDRVENITPTLAAGRNKRREERNLDGRWEMDLAAQPDPAPPTETPETPETTPNPDSPKPASKAKEAPVAKATTKKGGKAKAEAAGKKPDPKAPAPAAAPKEKTAKAAPAKKEVASLRGAALRFRELLEGGEKLAKEKVIAEVVKAGAKPGTAGSYVVWAKRPVSLGKQKNPFGFRIEETKDEAGKFLQRVGKKAK